MLLLMLIMEFDVVLIMMPMKMAEKASLAKKCSIIFFIIFFQKQV